MLDPVISAKIQKYGVFKWACMDFPHLVFGFATAVVGIGIGAYFANKDVQKRAKTAYFHSYVVMRPDDPRLKKTVIWGEDGKPIN